MPKCGKYHAKWKANMAKCSKNHAKCKVTMPKCSKYHAEWQVLVPNCCKYKANGTGKNAKRNSKTWGKKTTKNYSTPVTYYGWKKSCTTLDGWNLTNNGRNHRSTGAIFLPCTYLTGVEHLLIQMSTVVFLCHLRHLRLQGGLWISLQMQWEQHVRPWRLLYFTHFFWSCTLSEHRALELQRL